MPLRILLAIFQLDRHNRLYDFLLKVCKLAFNSLLPDPAGKGFLFQDVRRDESKMARVFQDFVRNFYALEQQKFAVEPLTIRWDAALLDFQQGRQVAKNARGCVLTWPTTKNHH